MASQKNRPENLSSLWSGVANLCCLAGIALVTYGAWLLHTAAGCFVSGFMLIGFGVHKHRVSRGAISQRR